MQTYTIRQISELFQVPASTLRYYEDIGLLPPVSRNSNNQRIYTDEHIQRLQGIHCFKRTGLPIAKICDFFHYENHMDKHIDDIVTLVTDHEEHIRLEIAKMQEDLLHIQQKVRFYNGIKKAITDNTPWPSWDDYNLDDTRK